MRLELFAVTALCGSLMGCGTVLQSLGGGATNTIGAEPLSISDTDIQNAIASKDAPTQREFLASVAKQSQQKCDTFKVNSGLVEANVDMTGDITATVFSALSTAFTPPGTKTALSAAATIASGSKTAVDTDFYQKTAMADFATAIQKTHDADIVAYLNDLPNLGGTSATPIVVNAELGKIQNYHGMCNLVAAESAIKAKLGTTGSQGGSGTTGNQTSPGTNGMQKNSEAAPTPARQTSPRYSEPVSPLVAQPPAPGDAW